MQDSQQGIVNRQSWVWLHRYLGLAIAAFLIVAGLTGSVIAFHRELDTWLNPELFRVQSRGAPLSPSELARRVEAVEPQIRVTAVPLQLAPGESALLSIAPRVDPATEIPYTIEYNQLFADPIIGQVLGTREWGDCCFERKHLIPFLYTLHHRLTIPGKWGMWLMGVVALAWLFSIFVGFYLTLPRRLPFWRTWKSAWLVKRGGDAFRVNFDLHRAAGLWLWTVLLVLAMSSVALNLKAEVFEPVVAFFSPLTPTPFDLRKPHPPDAFFEPTLSFEEAVARAVNEAVRLGWETLPDEVAYRPTYALYSVNFGPAQRGLVSKLGAPVLYVDGLDGRILGARVPGERSAGDVFMQLQYPLHSGKIVGLPGRIVICITGIAVAMLSITGGVIWLKRRRLKGASVRSSLQSVQRS